MDRYRHRRHVVAAGAALALLASCSGELPEPQPAQQDAQPAQRDSQPAQQDPPRAQSVESLDELLEVPVTGSSLARDAAAQRAQSSEQAVIRDLRSSQGAEVVTANGSRAFVSPRALAGQGQVAGDARERPLLAAEPGEEIWIIQTQGSGAAADGQVDDDAPGTGSLMAALADDEASALEPELIPLPLRHTDVDAAITGHVGTVDVTQQFENPYDEKIEAVYMFPLPEKAAVREFVMTIGERKIRGILREKQEAARLYLEARAQGYQASLLTQHRPNVFEQKVANIEPGKRIDVNIRYFHTLAYHDGWYSFVLPTVVGPRYNPPGFEDPVAALPRTALDGPKDGAAVRYLRPDERSAHEIVIEVEIDAGVAIEEVDASHPVETKRDGPNRAMVKLAGEGTIPNRDFVLRFRVAGDTIKSNLMTYVDAESDESYFTLMVYPPADLEAMERQPVEMVFVLDTSGSMNGAPLAQAKEAVLTALDRLGPDDTFQIIRFSNDASAFGPDPLPATVETLRRARRYVQQLDGGGGTEMLAGIRAALGFPHDERRLRFVTFMTDGFIGNESRILREVHDLIGDSRIFSFGIGNSVNRYLLERMASEGRGAGAYLGLEDSADEIMTFFFDRISHPALIDVEIVWGEMQASVVYPSRLPDLFVGRPVVVTGRYAGTAGDVTVRGRAAGRDTSFALETDGSARDSSFIPSLWARLRIAELTDEMAWTNDPYGRLARAIRDTALRYGLMSQYTAFVAVDASQQTAGTHGTTVHQAVPVPAGVRYDTTVQEQ